MNENNRRVNILFLLESAFHFGPIGGAPTRAWVEIEYFVTRLGQSFQKTHCKTQVERELIAAFIQKILIGVADTSSEDHPPGAA